MENTIINSMKKRRTIYNLGKGLPVMKSTLEDAVRGVIKYAPSAFNYKRVEQSSCMVTSMIGFGI
ncbi:MAG: hypothetical protein PHS03_01495 [Sphaerochaeta sp.]|nr:hypothetical protein [Sphaerochaeta sp.]